MRNPGLTAVVPALPTPLSHDRDAGEKGGKWTSSRPTTSRRSCRPPEERADRSADQPAGPAQAGQLGDAVLDREGRPLGVVAEEPLEGLPVVHVTIMSAWPAFLTARGRRDDPSTLAIEWVRLLSDL